MTGTARRELAAWAVTVAGPAAMWWSGFQVTIVEAVGLATLLAVVLALRPGWPSWARIGATVVLAAPLAPLTGVTVAAWLAVGGLLAEVAVRRRPLLDLGAPLPAGASVPALALAVPALLLPANEYDAVPTSLAAALGLAFVVGAVAPSPRRWIALLAAVGGPALVALVSSPDQNATPALLLVASATAVASAPGLAAIPRERWSLADLGPLVAGLPALGWLAVGTGLWASGLGDGSIGHRAWAAAVSELGRGTYEVLAATGVPSVVLGLLALGAGLVTDRNAALRRSGVGLGLALGAGLACGLAWGADLPVG